MSTAALGDPSLDSPLPDASFEGEQDLSQPVSILLRQGTAKAHQNTEMSKGAEWLTKGLLDKDEYIRFLMMLYHVYDTLEKGLDKHSTHPVLAPTYNPGLLARASRISSDISHLLGATHWQSHPMHMDLMTSRPPQLTAYTSRLAALASSPDPSPLLSHAYVRYLGDLSGGQIIRRRIAKAYELDSAGEGTRFYEFEALGGADNSMAEMRKIKDWYRAGMDKGVGDDEARKSSLVEEAILAFDLNKDLFTTLRGPEPPSTPVGNLVPASGKVVYDADLVQAEEPRMWSFSAVASVVIAAALAHFLLVVGGFTGIRGYEKWDLVWNWILGKTQ